MTWFNCMQMEQKDITNKINKLHKEEPHLFVEDDTLVRYMEEQNGRKDRN
jgi:hypothetical protein